MNKTIFMMILLCIISACSIQQNGKIQKELNCSVQGISKSTVALDGSGKRYAWDDVTKLNLTYCISDDFGSRKADMIYRMKQATEAWEKHANIKFIYVPSEDANATDGNRNVKIIVRLATDAERANHPEWDASATLPYVMPTSIIAIYKDPDILIFTHEIGHILGLLHEYIWWDKKIIEERGSEIELLTAIPDPRSIMMTPPYPVITDYDSIGVKKLYGAPERKPADIITLGPLVIDLSYTGFAVYGTRKLRINDNVKLFNKDQTGWSNAGAGFVNPDPAYNTGEEMVAGWGSRMENMICGLPVLRLRNSFANGTALSSHQIIYDAMQTDNSGWNIFSKCAEDIRGDLGFMDFRIDYTKFDPDITKGISVSDGGIQNIISGRYGSIEVRNNASLKLAGGVYQIQDLKTLGYSKIYFDTTTSPIVLFVKDTVDLKSKTDFLSADGIGADPSRILIVSGTSGGIYVAPSVNWRGTLIAPDSAYVNFDNGNQDENPVLKARPDYWKNMAFKDIYGNTTERTNSFGAIWAKEVEVHQYSSIYFVPLIWATIRTMSMTPGSGGIVTPKSSDATLSSLTVGGTSIALVSGTYTYSLSVPNATTSVSVTATTNSSATYTVIANPSTLVVGDNTVTVRVTSEDGTTTKDYNVTVTRLTAGTTVPPTKPIPITKSDTTVKVPAGVATTYELTLPSNGNISSIRLDSNTNMTGITILINGKSYSTNGYSLDTIAISPSVPKITLILTVIQTMDIKVAYW